MPHPSGQNGDTIQSFYVFSKRISVWTGSKHPSVLLTWQLQEMYSSIQATILFSLPSSSYLHQSAPLNKRLCYSKQSVCFKFMNSVTYLLAFFVSCSVLPINILWADSYNVMLILDSCSNIENTTEMKLKFNSDSGIWMVTWWSHNLEAGDKAQDSIKSKVRWLYCSLQLKV